MHTKMTHEGGFWTFIAKNVLVAVGVISVALLVTVWGLKRYTEHGVEVEVPSVKGLYAQQAQEQLEAVGLRMTIIDSTYSNKTPLGTIVEQNPVPGSHVKHGREVYVIENARFRRPVIMPEIRDMSLRQAQTTLRGLGLVVKNIAYEPSTYKNLVLDIRLNEQPVEAGMRLQEGSEVVLIVGLGKGTSETVVPTLIGKKLSEARSWLLSAMLTVGSIEYDMPPSEEVPGSDYMVYEQDPQAGSHVMEGTAVHIKLTTDVEKTVTYHGSDDDELFF